MEISVKITDKSVSTILIKGVEILLAHISKRWRQMPEELVSTIRNNRLYGEKLFKVHILFWRR